MNIIKSIMITIILILLFLLAVLITVRNIKVLITHQLAIKKRTFTLCIWSIAVCFAVLFGDYMYPFESHVDTVLIAEFNVPESYWLEYPGQKFWHGAYEQFGLFAESFYFNPSTKQSIYGFDWPPMNFKKFCYIITYGQKIDTLTYNVWETIDVPVRTGAKVGHMVLCTDFSPEKVYVYQIPKIRIENDVNGAKGTV